MADLATIGDILPTLTLRVQRGTYVLALLGVKNKFQSSGLEANLTFEKITQPTPLQQKALDLLDVSLFCTQ